MENLKRCEWEKEQAWLDKLERERVREKEE